jgi:hypothetical protein
VTWPTDLQKDLNKDAALKKAIGKSTFKVVNFGLDGTGLVQWPAVYRYKAKAFHPDLVVVNFIGNDMYRRFIYRDTVRIGSGDRVMITCSSLPVAVKNNHCVNAYSFVIDPAAPDYKLAQARIKSELYKAMVAHLPWFSPYPELLAVLLNGRFGLHPRLQFRDGSMFYFDSSEKAISESQNALKDIASQHPAVIALFHPAVEECLSKQPPDSVKELMKREENVKIVNMLDFLPLTSSEDEIKKWYNLPYDSHPSDYGAEVYANAVAGRISDYLFRAGVAARDAAQ